jgi:hypothetical protein
MMEFSTEFKAEIFYRYAHVKEGKITYYADEEFETEADRQEFLEESGGRLFLLTCQALVLGSEEIFLEEGNVDE